MAQPYTLSDLFEAVKKNWYAQGLDQVVTGGVYAFQPQERTPRPYVVLGEAKQSPTLFSNRNRYDDATFVMELVDENVGEAAPRLKAILAAFGERALAVYTGPNQGVILTLIPGDATYYDEMTYLRTVQEFTARVAQARVY